MRLVLVLPIAVVAIFGSGMQAGAQCLQAEGTDEFAMGFLTQETFSDAGGRPEPAFILSLPMPTCLSGNDETDNVTGARTIQIYSSNDAVDENIGNFVGESVFVRGEPFGAMTVHHHAPIVMDISEIDRPSQDVASAQEIFQPPRGSELRAALLDAARPVFEYETGGPIEFVVRHLNVLGDWAFGEVRLQRPGGAPIDWRKTQYAEDYKAGMFDPAGSFFLLHNAETGWVVVEYATGPTDVAWDSWRQDYGLPSALFQR